MGTIAAAALAVVAIVPVPSVAITGDVFIEEFPWIKPHARVLRTLEAKANYWYAVTLEGPREAHAVIALGGTGLPGGALTANVGFKYLPELTAQTFSFGSGGGGPREVPAFAEVRVDGVDTIVVGEEYGRGPGGDRRGGVAMHGSLWAFNGRRDAPPTIRTSFLWFMTSDSGIRDVGVHLSADPGVKVIAESWGRGVNRLLVDGDFRDGGYRAAANAARVGAAVADLKMRRTVTFQRSASALFFPGMMGYYGPIGVPEQHAVMSVKSRHRAWKSTIAEDGSIDGNEARSLKHKTIDGEQIPVVGEEDRYYSTGENYFAGLPPGSYEFTIEAFAAAQGPFVGMEPYVALLTIDADGPACTFTRVQWREKDGRKVCGPGPWRMKRGLPI